MESAEIIGAIIGGTTIALLLLVIVLFRSVYIILPRKEFEERYVLKDLPAQAEQAEKEPALV